jgi:hypothetical protein
VASSLPVAAQEGPTDEQMLDVFRDEWGETDFRETGIGDWETVASWDRAAQFAFAPGTDERDADPVPESGLAPLRLVVFTREAHGRTETQVTEVATRPDGTEVPNYFPIFRGTPASMEFYNPAGIPGLPAGEVHQRCRELVEADRSFLVCRVLASDGSIRSQVKVPEGSPATGLPEADEVTAAFRDQWGRDTFRPSGSTPWEVVSAWQRFRLIAFPEGGHELNSTPTELAQDPFRVWLLRRTVNGRPELQEINRIEPEGVPARTEGFAFDRFAGDPTDWFFFTAPPPQAELPGGEIRLHRRFVTFDGRPFVVVRVLFPEDDPRFDVIYYVMQPISDAPPTRFNPPPA